MYTVFDRIKQLVRGDGKKQPAEGAEHEASPAEQFQIQQMNASQIDAILAQKPENDPVAADSPAQAGPDRTFEHDTTRVKEQCAKIPDKVFRMMKGAAFANPSMAKDVGKAKARNNYYGGANHRAYGAAVAELTGGRITAEEAMRMNPSGGIAGNGLYGIAFDDGVLHNHAIWHDACGFLITNFNIGPGYGGDSPANPLSGQFEGIGREMRRTSNLPSGDAVASPVQTRQDLANDEHA